MTTNTTFESTVEATLILGRTGTGKSESALLSASSRSAQAQDRGNVILFSPSDMGARTLQRRLMQLDPAAADKVAITTPRAFALEILSTQQAKDITKRDARLPLPMDQDFIVEDLKTSGMKQGRMREMLRFFYRSWTELADDDPNWLYTSEEEGLHALLKENLALRRCMLEPEVSNLARNVLLQTNRLDGRFDYSHVIVDDYQMLSRASQHLCCLVARASITVTGDPCACIEVQDSYPYAAGLEEFARCFERLSTTELSTCHSSDALQKATERLCAAESIKALPARPAPDVNPGDIEGLILASHRDEYIAVAQRVANLLSEGTATNDVVIAAPNPNWANNILAACNAVGVPAAAATNDRIWHGSFSDMDACKPARLLSALRLVANNADDLAWRSWCGFGDYLGGSAGFIALRKVCLERGVRAAWALDQLAKGALNLPEGSLKTDKIVEAYRKGLSLCEQVAGLDGRQLLDAIAQQIAGDSSIQAPASFVTICEPEAGKSAQAMLESALKAFESPRDSDKVHILTYREALGTCAKHLIVSGFVNGLIPKGDWFDLTKTSLDKQAKQRSEYAALVYGLVGTAQETVTLSSFSDATLDDATALNLKIERIRAENGTRMCKLSSSIFQAPLLGQA